jgi:inner membrane protein
MSAVAIGAAVLPYAPARVWTVLAVSAAIPDLDALGRPFGYGDVAVLGGHRALTHSLTFAALMSLFAGWRLQPRPAVLASLVRLWAAVFIAVASHGVLDAFTAYGAGVAFLAPWSWTRFHAPWPLLAGILSDTALFLIAAVSARIMIRRRGWPLPPVLAWPRSNRVT